MSIAETHLLKIHLIDSTQCSDCALIRYCEGEQGQLTSQSGSPFQSSTRGLLDARIFHEHQCFQFWVRHALSRQFQQRSDRQLSPQQDLRSFRVPSTSWQGRLSYLLCWCLVSSHSKKCSVLAAKYPSASIVPSAWVSSEIDIISSRRPWRCPGRKTHVLCL